MRKVAVLLLWIAAAMGCWFLFVASSSSHEVWLGAAFTVLTVSFSALAWRHMPVSFSPAFGQIPPLLRIPWYVLRDSVEVTLVLAQDILHITPAGSFYRAAAFNCGSGEHSDACAVLTTAGTSMTPSIIILGITGDHLFFHQLQREPLPRMVSELEAPQ